MNVIVDLSLFCISEMSGLLFANDLAVLSYYKEMCHCNFLKLEKVWASGFGIMKPSCFKALLRYQNSAYQCMLR